MSDIFTPEKRSAVMARILSRGNKATEIKLMEMMRAMGIRGWRRQVRVVVKTGHTAGGERSTIKESLRKEALSGKSEVKEAKSGRGKGEAVNRLRVRPDFVFWKARVAVFVDGCFWHGCPRHGTKPKQNGEFWAAKISRNQTRDRKVVRELRKAGWTVLRIWECALTKARAMRTLGRIRRAVEWS